MWLYRGVQSAVFYYASCTPCANSIDRRKRLKDAVRSKREREKGDALVTDQPRPFAQPIPFSTNPGWSEEIALGPGPPARNHRALNRRTDSWNTDGFSGSDLDVDNADGPPSHKKEKGSSRERWNRMRYQREDEPLWGQEAKGPSVGRSGRGRPDAKESSKYYIARVPPVNDLHPPIVSGPKSRAETRWMLQPPPSAKVMAGKEGSRAAVRCSPPGSSTIDEEDENATVSPTWRKPSPEGKRPQQQQQQQQQQEQQPEAIPEKKSSRPSPIAVSPVHPSHKPSTPQHSSRFPRRASSTSMAHGRDESNFVIASLYSPSEPPSPLSSADSEDGGSPSLSWRCPQTPVSRPVSKANDDSGKPGRPAISKTLSSLHPEQNNNNKVQMLQLEINDSPEDVGMGQFEPIRPYRWSMDI